MISSGSLLSPILPLLINAPRDQKCRRRIAFSEHHNERFGDTPLHFLPYRFSVCNVNSSTSASKCHVYKLFPLIKVKPQRITMQIVS